MAIDPRFRRIAKRLRVFELTCGDDGEDLGLGPGLVEEARARTRFLDFYSVEGLRRALDAYGVTAALSEQGLNGWEVVVGSDEAGRSRLQVLLDGILDDDHRLVDLVMRAERVRAEVLAEDGEIDVLLVDWLCLQNPRATFSPERPRLPGQCHPGLGLGHTFHNITLLMARRLGRDGVLNVPEHYHLARIYDRAGYHFVDETHREEVEAAQRATRTLHFAVAAWAVERGFVHRVAEDGTVTPWTYTPAEMVAPVSGLLQSALGRLPAFLQDLLRPRPRVHMTVELEGLRRSLATEPVEGLDPERIVPRD